jgi:hypothetical protein
MAATGGRNQRRLANLKTETSRVAADGDHELSILSQSIVEQTRLRSNLLWAAEKDRLTALVEMGRLISGVPESEKSTNLMELYNFLKRPIEEVKPDKPTGDTKRLKFSDDKLPNHVALSYSTPASALATSSCSTTSQAEQENVFPHSQYTDAYLNEQDTNWECDDEYGEEYCIAI